LQELQLNEKTRSERKAWSWTPRHLNQEADIKTVMNELKEWWPMTARQVYYRLISKKFIKQKHWLWKRKGKKRLMPLKDPYQTVKRLLKWMRIDERLPWNAITDEHRVTTHKLGYTDIREFFDEEISDFLYGYSRCKAQKQENYIEVWIEKAALLHIVKPIADKYCRRVVCCRGYNSITFQSMFYSRATEAINAGEQPIVLYFGDWDPSGENMIYAAMQTLEDELDLCGVKYFRAGINPEHFDMVEADPVAIKKKDSRSKRFVEQYGYTAYELDAFHPNQLQALVEDAICDFTDMSEYEDNEDMESSDVWRITPIRNKMREYFNELTHEIES